jgi:CMP-N-acetylneuraminic acid synthetase
MDFSNYNILGVTLARGGSKGVKKKNIIPVNGIPLIAYTVMEALKSKNLTGYIISTDDEEIANIARIYGADVPFMRPKHLASDTATSTDALIHAVEWCENNMGIRFDYIIELMCTNPMKTSVDIDLVLDKLISTGADSVIGVSKLDDHHPARIKKIVNDRIVDFCVPELSSRRQDLKPDAYIRNGSIYAMKRDILMIKKERFGSTDSRPYIMPAEKAFNIDNEIDLKMAELLLKGENRTYIKPVEEKKK